MANFMESVQVCPRLRRFPGCRTFSAKTRKVPGKLGEVGPPTSVCSPFALPNSTQSSLGTHLSHTQVLGCALLGFSH